MVEVVEIPLELTKFQLPEAVQSRLQFLLDCQDSGRTLAQAERQEAQGLIDLAEFLSLLCLRSQRVTKKG
ncbi:DUF2281 domain-containing protein [Tumidithrix helvetica PCC 7403]|uniref:hypothetical protein n=1 Tax=Tumidithrix helvetica TaxID=3457545 RepID=UPI003C86535D